MSIDSLHATPQRPDRIKIDGISYPLCNTLLYSELSDAKREEIIMEIAKVATQFSIVFSTSLRRGHVCLWEIKNNELYFKGMNIPLSAEDSSKEHYFTHKNINAEIPGLDLKTGKYSYTGKLIVATGKCTGLNRHSTFGYVYSEYRVLEVTDGLVKHAEKAYNPDPFPNDRMNIQIKNPQEQTFRVLFCNPNAHERILQIPQGVNGNSSNVIKIKAFDVIPINFDMNAIKNKKIINILYENKKMKIQFRIIK